MSIDVFGRQLRQQQQQQSQQHFEAAAYLKLNSIDNNHDFDAGNHRLRNLADGLAPGDAVNVNILTKMIDNVRQSSETKSKELHSVLEARDNAQRLSFDSKSKVFEAAVEKKLETFDNAQRQSFDSKVKELQSKLEAAVEKKLIETLDNVQQRQSLESKNSNTQLLSDIESAVDEKLKSLDTVLDSKRKKLQSDIEITADKKIQALNTELEQLKKLVQTVQRPVEPQKSKQTTIAAAPAKKKKNG